jgi:hypothetical protein
VIWMRAIGLSIALVLVSVSVVRALTLLEIVLYIVSGQESRNLVDLKNSVTQDEKSIHGELFWRDRPSLSEDHLLRSTSVKRISGCKFEVDDEYGYDMHGHGGLRATYSVDFSFAELEKAYPVELPTIADIYHPAVIIPGTRFCLTAGRLLRDNDIGAGFCADTFVVEPRGGNAMMLAAVHHLRKFCPPKVS